MMRRLPFLLAVALVATACPFEVAGPRTDLEGLPDGLEVTLEVEPQVVAPHAPFTATLSVRNRTAEPISVTTASTCLAVLHVLRDGRRIPFQGSEWGCGDAISTHVIPPGETRTLTWNVRAELYAEEPDDPEGAPAPRGIYWVQAQFDVHVPGVPDKPSVVTMLRVR